MDYQSMKRKDLQALCKKHQIPANLSNLEMANRLAQHLKEIENSSNQGLGSGKSETESTDVVTSKKVRFRPEHELIEFSRSPPMKRTRGKSLPIATVEYVGGKGRSTRKAISEGIDAAKEKEIASDDEKLTGGRTVRVTRSRGQKSGEGDLPETKRARTIVETASGEGDVKRVATRGSSSKGVEVTGKRKEEDLEGEAANAKRLATRHSSRKGVEVDGKDKEEVLEGEANAKKVATRHSSRKGVETDGKDKEEVLEGEADSKKVLEGEANAKKVATRHSSRKGVETDGKDKEEVLEGEADSMKVASRRSTRKGVEIDEKPREGVSEDEANAKRVATRRSTRKGVEIDEKQGEGVSEDEANAKRVATRRSTRKGVEIDEKKGEGVSEDEANAKRVATRRSSRKGVEIDENQGEGVLEDKVDAKRVPTRSSSRKGVEIKGKQEEDVSEITEKIEEVNPAIAPQVLERKSKRNAKGSRKSEKLLAADVNAEIGVSKGDPDALQIVEPNKSSVRKSNRSKDLVAVHGKGRNVEFEEETENTSQLQGSAPQLAVAGEVSKKVKKTPQLPIENTRRSRRKTLIHVNHEAEEHVSKPVENVDECAGDSIAQQMSAAKKQEIEPNSEVVVEVDDDLGSQKQFVEECINEKSVSIVEAQLSLSDREEINTKPGLSSDTENKSITRKTQMEEQLVSIGDNSNSNGMDLVGRNVLPNSVDLVEDISASNIKGEENFDSVESDFQLIIEQDVTNIVKNQFEVQPCSQIKGSSRMKATDDPIFQEDVNVSGIEGSDGAIPTSESDLHVNLEVKDAEADTHTQPGSIVIGEEGISVLDNLDLVGTGEANVIGLSSACHRNNVDSMEASNAQEVIASESCEEGNKGSSELALEDTHTQPGSIVIGEEGISVLDNLDLVGTGEANVIGLSSACHRNNVDSMEASNAQEVIASESCEEGNKGSSELALEESNADGDDAGMVRHIESEETDIQMGIVQEALIDASEPTESAMCMSQTHTEGLASPVQEESNTDEENEEGNEGALELMDPSPGTVRTIDIQNIVQEACIDASETKGSPMCMSQTHGEGIARPVLEESNTDEDNEEGTEGALELMDPSLGTVKSIETEETDIQKGIVHETWINASETTGSPMSMSQSHDKGVTSPVLEESNPDDDDGKDKYESADEFMSDEDVSKDCAVGKLKVERFCESGVLYAEETEYQSENLHKIHTVSTNDAKPSPSWTGSVLNNLFETTVPSSSAKTTQENALLPTNYGEVSVSSTSSGVDREDNQLKQLFSTPFKIDSPTNVDGTYSREEKSGRAGASVAARVDTSVEKSEAKIALDVKVLASENDFEGSLDLGCSSDNNEENSSEKPNEVGSVENQLKQLFSTPFKIDSPTNVDGTYSHEEKSGRAGASIKARVDTPVEKSEAQIALNEKVLASKNDFEGTFDLGSSSDNNEENSSEKPNELGSVDNQLKQLFSTPFKIDSPTNVDGTYSHGEKSGRAGASIKARVITPVEKSEAQIALNEKVLASENDFEGSLDLGCSSDNSEENSSEKPNEVESFEMLNASSDEFLNRTDYITEEIKDGKVIAQGGATENYSELREWYTISSAKSDLPDALDNSLHLTACQEDTNLSPILIDDLKEGPMDGEEVNTSGCLNSEKDVKNKGTSPSLILKASNDGEDVTDTKHEMAGDVAYEAKIWDENDDSSRSFHDISGEYQSEDLHENRRVSDDVNPSQSWTGIELNNLFETTPHKEMEGEISSKSAKTTHENALLPTPTHYKEVSVSNPSSGVDREDVGYQQKLLFSTPIKIVSFPMGDETSSREEKLDGADVSIAERVDTNVENSVAQITSNVESSLYLECSPDNGEEINSEEPNEVASVELLNASTIGLYESPLNFGNKVFSETKGNIAPSSEAEFELSNADIQKSNVLENSQHLTAFYEDNNLNEMLTETFKEGPMDAEVTNIVCSLDGEEDAKNKGISPGLLLKTSNAGDGATEMEHEIADEEDADSGDFCNIYDDMNNEAEKWKSPAGGDTLESQSGSKVSAGTVAQNLDNTIPASGGFSEFDVFSNLASHMSAEDNESGDSGKSEKNSKDLEDNSISDDATDYESGEIVKSDLGTPLFDLDGDNEENNEIDVEENSADTTVHPISELHLEDEILESYKDVPTPTAIGSNELLKESDVDDTIKEYIDSEVDLNAGGVQPVDVVHVGGADMLLKESIRGPDPAPADLVGDYGDRRVISTSSGEFGLTAKKNARTILIHGTPGKAVAIADMKENAPTHKNANAGDATAARPPKRKALQDVHWK